MKTSLAYKFRSGKKPKFIYYINAYFALIIPKWLFRMHLKYVLKKSESRRDYTYITSRVDYYNRLSPNTLLPDNAPVLSEHKPGQQKVYFFDSYIYTRWFSGKYRWGFCPGDVTYVPKIPSIVKSRPLIDNNENSIVMKLDKIRHFVFVKDRKRFSEKKDMAIFRGKVHDKQLRIEFMEKFFGSDICDAGDVSRRSIHPEWIVPKLTLYQHLDYKFIMALEGNDVASNLKWVMSSNSIAVMPRPTCETWFMEGTLIPDYHYIEIKSDFSDLEQKLKYYIDHPDEAEAISRHANEYVAQFRDRRREKIISLLVLDKYFRATGQK